MPLTLADFTFELPPESIAQTPASPRDASKLLVLNRQTKTLTHLQFSQLPEVLQPGDVLVRNNTKVLPARLFGKKDTGGKIELLLHRELTHTPTTITWECMTKPGLTRGQSFVIASKNHSLLGSCSGLGSSNHTRTITFTCSKTAFYSTLAAVGAVPLPPYIKQSEQSNATTLESAYQTTFAKKNGSVAAPTAGLHFTQELDARLEKMGVTILEVTLHVGMGTFLPVTTNQVTEHHMHKEVFELSQETATAINKAKAEQRRVIAVGTTTVRVLESCAEQTGTLRATTGETAIFIYPPYRFAVVDGLITNFHLPQSSLLMLVSAFVSKPNTTESFQSFAQSSVGKAYQVALEKKYRFYSFGDAMLML